MPGSLSTLQKSLIYKCTVSCNYNCTQNSFIYFSLYKGKCKIMLSFRVMKARKKLKTLQQQVNPTAQEPISHYEGNFSII